MQQSFRLIFVLLAASSTPLFMNFQDLHELLRLELLRRLDRGVLTGTRLAQQTGFRQAHISNFLNGKRPLSLEGLDRVMSAQGITIEEILPIDFAASATAAAAPEPTEIVPVVSAVSAMNEPRMSPGLIVETLHLAASRLADNRAQPSPKNPQWQRFVAIRSDVQQAAAMEPMLAPGTIAVIDRHYNCSLHTASNSPTSMLSAVETSCSCALSTSIRVVLSSAQYRPRALSN
jgi:plasmid maintenance system antidote protein VapI